MTGFTLVWRDKFVSQQTGSDPRYEKVNVSDRYLNVMLGIIESTEDPPPDFWGFDYHSSLKIQTLEP